MKYDVCVFGGCSIDQMFYQNIDGSYNEIPNFKTYGGKGSNQAVASARAGGKTTIISRVGKDDIGKSIIENLSLNMVDTSNVEMLDIDNDYSSVYINIEDKDNDIKRHSGAIDSFTKDMVENNRDVLLNSSVILCQLKCPLDVTEELINFCYKNNKILILTPCRPEKLKNRVDLIDKITIITCNRHECETIFGTDNIEECVKQYPNKLIVTLGSDGLMYYNGNRVVKMPALDVNVIDTTGAGDTLCGNLAVELARGSDLKHALRRSMYASSLKIQVKSAQAGMPYREDLDKFIRNYRNKKFKYNKEIEVAIELVKEAYFRIKSNKNFNISVKRDNSLVTNVDIEVENFIINGIKEKFPNDNFLTEENYPNNELINRTWIIDPIDGTNQFIKDTPFWGIQLAFYADDSTKFSVIYLPKSNELYHAIENQGAYLNNDKILNVKINPIKQSIIEFGGSIYKEFDEKKQILAKLMHNNKFKVAGLLHINSCCVAYSNLASSKTDALIISTKKKWDIMPGLCLCKEAGIKSYPIDFDNKITLLTANEEIKSLILSDNNDNN